MRLAGARIGAMWAAGLAVAIAAVLEPRAAADSARCAELLRAGYQHVYNLDFDEALAAFHRAVDADPQNPAAYRAVAAVTWLNLMFTRGALSSDEFLSSLPENNAAVKPPPADAVAVFRAN